MDIFALNAATGDRESVVWAFVVVGTIAGGVIGSMAAFGLVLQSVTSNFFLLAICTFLGWLAGAAIGGGLGLAGGRLTERVRQPPFKVAPRATR